MATRQATAQAARTVRQVLDDRGAEATRNLREMLQLPADVSDVKILGTALAEVAAEEGRRNPRFASDVRKRYDELVGLRGSPAKRASRQAQEPLEPLVPIRRFEGHREVDPFKPPDPHFLSQLYGSDKLARALREYTVDQLKGTAAEIEARHRGTKPTNRGRLEPLIAYIVEWTHKEEG